MCAAAATPLVALFPALVHRNSAVTVQHPAAVWVVFASQHVKPQKQCLSHGCERSRLLHLLLQCSAHGLLHSLLCYCHAEYHC